MSRRSQWLSAIRYARLSDVASVHVGLAFRAKLEPDAAGSVQVVQARDITGDGTVDVGGANTIAERKLKPDHLLRAGDIVLQPRGTAVRAGLVTELPGDTVAAAPLQIIRPKVERVVPAYLVVVLNAPATIAALLQEARGSHILQVPPEAVANARIPLPPLDKQRAIVALSDLVRAEKRVLSEIAVLRSRLLEAVIAEGGRDTRRRANASG